MFVVGQAVVDGPVWRRVHFLIKQKTQFNVTLFDFNVKIVSSFINGGKKENDRGG